MSPRSPTPFLLALLGATGLASPAAAQEFDSGSDGSDGALTFPADAGTILFDPADFDPPLDQDGDNVYQFESVTIPEGTTVKLRTSTLPEGVPVVWLSSGDVEIAGELNLKGEDGHSESTSVRLPAVAGAGGYTGGRGRHDGLGLDAEPGNGPGGAPVEGNNGNGRGAGHATPGDGAPAYGNAFLLPLVGGSGGSGGSGNSSNNGGGGAGGGALLLASSTQVVVSGTVRANGGHASTGGFEGGGGSGGAIRLMAPSLSGGGAIRARGGNAAGGGTDGSPGRIRLESFKRTGLTNVVPSPSVATPGSVFLPPTAPLVRVTAIDGVAVTNDPSGSFLVADAEIDAASAVTVEIAAENVPVGTVLTLTLQPQTGDPVTVQSSPLDGTRESSTATASVTFPHGFSRLFVRASWDP